MSINIPAFGETEFTANMSDEKSTVTLIKNADEALFENYVKLFSENGYTEKESYTRGTHRFSAFLKESEGVFLNYFGGTGEIYVLAENDCRYFDFEDKPLEPCVKPQITQVHLEAAGMSYAIRLSDGRFILIDGGRWHEPDTDRLYEVIKKTSPYEKPIIAAWIMTHPHSDHFHAFMPFTEKYGDDVVIDTVLYNFPKYDDLEQYPILANKPSHLPYDISPICNIPKMFEAAESVGARLVTARTGQIYKIGDAVCEIIASMDDTINSARNLNATSLVIRMELGSQVILWTADMTISDAKLNEKYGDYLKCHIMQVPHHGFMSGDPKVLIEFYKLAKPAVCLLPVSKSVGYSDFSTYMEATEYLFRNADVEEMIDDDTTRTLTLPYRASASGKRELESAYLKGRDDGGALTWVYNDMLSDCDEDCIFTVLNTTVVDAKLNISIYCEDSAQNINHIKAVIPRSCRKTINIFNTDDVDGNAGYANSKPLIKQGRPENTGFSVHITSNVPVVISNKNKKETYHSINR